MLPLAELTAKKMGATTTVLPPDERVTRKFSLVVLPFLYHSHGWLPPPTPDKSDNRPS
jgi:hypothetical protein